MTRAVSVAELQRAWGALQRGAFRGPASAGGFVAAAGERLLAVVGVGGGVGASTVALALAEGLGAARLVDGAASTASGLVAACERELPASASGWARGRRGDLLVERCPLPLAGAPAACPLPPDAAGGVTVLDAGWDALALLGGDGWLSGTIRDPAVPLLLVARGTTPSLRRLDVALDALAAPGRTLAVAVLGPPLRRWPRHVTLPSAADALRRSGRLAVVPLVDALATRGLDAAPLPAPVRDAVNTLTREGTLR